MPFRILSPSRLGIALFRLLLLKFPFCGFHSSQGKAGIKANKNLQLCCISWDHEDHDGLNCQRSNLRPCVRGENGGNQRKTRGASKFKGVSWDSSRGLWRAYITVHNTSKYLGRFHDERDAALAYDAAARAAFGEFAFCNFSLQE